MVSPEDPSAAEIRDRIEQARDPSHTHALPKSEFKRVFAAAGLRILAMETDAHPRSFDHWMHVAGWKRGDREYVLTRRLLEATMAGVDAGFLPRFIPAGAGVSGPEPDIQMNMTSLFIAAEKP
jgi:hypothetical protein